MTNRSLAFLIVLNAALLMAVFVMPSGTQQPAQAQFGGGRSYTMIAGQVTGRNNQAAVYVIDLSSSAVAPIFFNASSKELEFFQGSIVSDDAARMGEARR